MLVDRPDEGTVEAREGMIVRVTRHTDKNHDSCVGEVTMAKEDWIEVQKNGERFVVTYDGHTAVSLVDHP